MGYKPPVKRYRLQFEGADFDGLEVVMGGLSTGEVIDINTAMMTQSGEEIEAALKLTASKIVRWNVEDDDGAEMPRTLESLRSLDMAFVMAIVTRWVAAATGVVPPLPGSSNGTGTTLPGSIPMEALSGSPSS